MPTPTPPDVTFVDLVPTDADPAALMKEGAPGLAPTVSAGTIARDPDGCTLLAVAKYGPGLADVRAAARAYPAGNTLRSNGVRNLSRSFGYLSRNQILQRNACRSCSGATEAPGQHLALVNAAARLAEIATRFYPDRFAEDAALVAAAVLPEWRMSPAAPWTSGVVNFDSPLPYHYDRNNFDVFSSMITFRRGIRGGHLHCPQWAFPDGTPVVLDCADGDVTMFNGQAVLHGVTPFEMLQPTSYRISAVFYAVHRMKECLPFPEEIAFGRRSRSDREDNWRATQEAL